MQLTKQGAVRLTDEACQFNGKDFYLIPSLLETHDFAPNEFTGAVILSFDEVLKIQSALMPGDSFNEARELLAERLLKSGLLKE